MAESGGTGVNLTATDATSTALLFPPNNAFGKNMIRVHPMLADGAIKSFAPLHNVNSPCGFVYMNAMGSFRVAQLPAQFNYDHLWACCKVALKRCTQKISYHTSSQTHIVATSSGTAFSLTRARYAAAVVSFKLNLGCRCY